MANSVTPSKTTFGVPAESTHHSLETPGGGSTDWRAPVRHRTYHIGNVRAALLKEARVLLLERGITGLNLRTLSNRAGVALGSVYHHFDSKAGLLAGLVAQGFTELTVEISRASQASHGQMIRNCAHAYFAFGRREPELYSLMFAFRMAEDPGVSTARATTFEALKVALQTVAPDATAEEIQDVALAVWASVHGAATLGPLGVEGEGLMEAVIRGLELLFHPRATGDRLSRPIGL